jgi:hypothetical protein
MCERFGPQPVVLLEMVEPAGDEAYWKEVWLLAIVQGDIETPVPPLPLPLPLCFPTSMR